MERIRTLLQELIIQSRKPRLFGLLLRATRAKKSLPSGEASLGETRAESGNLLPCGELALQILSPDPLLAHGGLNALLITLGQQWRNGLRRGETLLPHQLRTLNARPVPTERTGLNSFGLLLGKLLSLLLLKVGKR